MNRTAILKDVKRHRSSLDIVNGLLKGKSSNKIETYLIRLNRSYEKHMAKLNHRLSK